MPTISTYLKMFDQFSRPLERTTSQVTKTITVMENMKKVVERPSKLNIDATGVQKQLAGLQKITQSAKIDIAFNAKEAQRKAQLMHQVLQKELGTIKSRIQLELPASLTMLFSNLQRLVLKLTASTRRLQNATNVQSAAQQQVVHLQQQISQLQSQINSKTQQAEHSSSNWLSNLKGIAATYLSFQGLKAGINTSDDYVNTLARLDLINDKMQTTKELQEDIFKAADRSRGSYQDMAGVIGRMGILASDAFKDNKELIGFSELMQKSFRVGGASTMEQQAGMYQLSQAMAAGKLQGDEFRSIMENAPMLADAIAKFTGKTKGDLKDMSADGVITSDIIKGAMFAAADDINGKFATMPRTFGDIFNKAKNHALRKFGPIIERINGMLNSQVGEKFISFFINGITILAALTNNVIDAFVWLGSTINTIYSYAEPLIYLIGAALTLWAVTQIPMLITKLWLMTQPILASAVAWLAMHWPILLIGAAIGFLLYAILNWQDETVTAVGVVGGIFGILIGYLFNNFAYFANMVLSVAEFFVNVWKDPVYAVKKLFYDLVINALSYLQNLASGIEDIINKIPGINVNLTEGMGNLLNKLENARDNLSSEADVVQLMRFEQKDYGEAFNAGQKVGSNIGSGIIKGVNWASDKLEGFNGKGFGFSDPTNNFMATMPDGIDKIGKVGEVGKIKNSVDISSEDLRMMRELAEMKNIQNFVTLQPQLSFGDTHVKQDGRTVDEIVANITTRLNDEIASSAKGVFV